MGVRVCGIALALCVFVPVLAVSAQETVNSASVSGRVTDPQGAVVPGAQVSARQIETNVTRETVTDREGRFRFPYLKVGRYEITVRLKGFADATRLLTLTVGSAFEVPVSLKVGVVDTNVTVSAEATVLEAARSQIAGTVSQTEVRNLPMNGATSSTSRCSCPDKAREFAGDRGHDLLFRFTSGGEAVVPPMQPVLRGPRVRDDLLWAPRWRALSVALRNGRCR